MLVCWLGSLGMEAQSNELFFSVVNKEQGLSDLTNSFVYRDSKGLVWMSSLEGVVCFDGEQVKEYSSQNEKYKLADNIVTSTFFEDDQQNLWFSTFKGIQYYDRQQDTFATIQVYDQAIADKNIDYFAFHYEKGILWFRQGAGNAGRIYCWNSITHQLTYKGRARGNRQLVVKDKQGQLIGIMATILDQGGALYYPLADTLLSPQYIVEPDAFKDVAAKVCYTFNAFQDPNGLVWIGTNKGLVAYDPIAKTKRAFAEFQGQVIGSIWSIQQFDQNHLLFSSDQLGLCTIALENNELDGRFIARFPEGMSFEKRPREVYLDRDHCLWVSYWGEGVAYTYLGKKTLETYFISDYGVPLLEEIKQLQVDAEGNIWAYIKGDGFKVLDAALRVKKEIPFSVLDEMGEDEMLSFVVKREDTLLLATGTSLYFVVDGVGKKLHDFQVRLDRFFPLEGLGDFVSTFDKRLFEVSRAGNLVQANDKFDNFQGVLDAAYYDGEQWLIFGCNASTIMLFSKEDGAFKEVKQFSKVGYVSAIQQEKNSEDFIIASNKGLFRLQRENWELLPIEDKQGPLRSIRSLAQDEDGYFWIYNSAGLFRFDPRSGDKHFFLRADGFVNAGHRAEAFLVDPQNRLLIGGRNGLNVLELSEENTFTVQPQIHIQEVLVNNEPIDYDRNVAEMERIRLPYKKNSLAFKFASTEFSSPSKNQYRYKLQDQADWQFLGTRNELFFDRLPFGNYRLSIQAANADGVWMEEKRQIVIKILPPIYLRWWFIGLVAALLAWGTYWLWKYREKQLIIKRESERLRELDEFKTRLYTNITHEFRTPLTVIKGMTEQVKGNLVERQMIRRNSMRLLNLVNQMLDLAKLDEGNLKLELGQTDVVAFIKYTAETYQPYAGSKNIRVDVVSDFDQLIMDVDQNKLDQVLSNLLSNAIKFSPEKSTITVDLNRLEDTFILKVADQGIGIPEDKLEKVFDRFFQIDSSSTRKTSGSGIGLALTKELVILMNGEISVAPQVEQGSVFTVILPIQNQAIWKPFIHPEILQEPLRFEQSEAIIEEGGGQVLPKLLIVEDNPDVATYIASLLQGHYQLQYAKNGAEGLSVAQQTIPDIIISDVMMPIMDGYELCKRLKEDMATSHIPIVMLTAKSHVEDRLEGLKLGADAYLTKPFNRDELKIRLKKLIELRKQMQNKYGTDLLNIQLHKEENKEESFLNQLRRLVLNRIDDQDLSTADLGKAVFLSDSQVNRKLKALTLMTPSAFIRSIRLEHALVLLKTTDMSITQIAYEVGFNQPAYFTRRFQEKYKVSPSEARKGDV